MPSSTLIFVPLLAGFIFLRLFNITRYVSRMWEGPRLVFATGVFGLVFIGLSRFAVTALRPTAAGEYLRDLVKSAFPDEYSGTLFGCVGLAVAFALLLNGVFPKNEAVLWTTGFGDRLHAFLTTEMARGEEANAIALNLADSKVYVGFVLEPPSLDPKDKDVAMLPTLSGYRDASRVLRVTINYESVLRTTGLRPEDLRVVIPLDQIVSAHPFDPNIYRKISQDAIPTHEEIEGSPTAADTSEEVSGPGPVSETD
ncbi:MAG: hypothetical protein M3547_00980 [Acidobacteriota bacterium]|nr:hypothetical protein [Acidobacteriota bacterium]